MSEQNPHSPQSPHSPSTGQAPYDPYAYAYAHAEQTSYVFSAEQAGYPQVTSQPGTASIGAPYASSPYPQQPTTSPDTLQAAGSVRPRTATGASALGIVSGVLGTIDTIITAVILIDLRGSVLVVDGKLIEHFFVDVIELFAIFATAIILIISGTMFLKGNAAFLLLGAAITQAVLTIVEPLMAMTLPTFSVGAGTILRLLVGLGLSGATIKLLMTESARAWRK